LLEQGLRRIGHISGPLDWWEARQRKQAWQDTLHKAGVTFTDKACAEGNWSSSSAEAAFIELLESYPGMEAVFVGNDQMALTVLQVAHRRGLRIPRDLAVIGFDNMAESAYFWPRFPPSTTTCMNWAAGPCKRRSNRSRRFIAMKNWNRKTFGFPPS